LGRPAPGRFPPRPFIVLSRGDRKTAGRTVRYPVHLYYNPPSKKCLIFFFPAIPQARRINLRQNRATSEEAEFLLHQRVELNALTSDQLVAFIEQETSTAWC